MRIAVITIHGVLTPRSIETWQDKFLDFLHKNQTKDKLFSHNPFKYGFLGPILAWIISLGKVVDNFVDIPTPIRDYYVRKFCKHIEKVYKENPNAKISIFAHSFGGWIAEKAIEKLSANYGFIELHSVVYVQCPISCHIEQGFYRSLLETGRIKKVRSIFSTEDMIIKYIAIPPFGQNGVYGFLRDGYEGRQPYPELDICSDGTREYHNGVVDDLDKYNTLIIDGIS